MYGQDLTDSVKIERKSSRDYNDMMGPLQFWYYPASECDDWQNCDYAVNAGNEKEVERQIV